MAVLKTIIGLVFDDWWLAFGTLFAIVLTKVALVMGLKTNISGVVLIAIILISLIISLSVEYKKKK